MLFALVLTASAPHAEVPADGASKLKIAQSEFSALAQKVREQTRPPRLADPAEGAILDRVWNASAIIGQPPHTAKDVLTLLDAFAMQNIVLKTFVFFSANPSQPPDTARNTALYQDEIVRSWAAVLRTAAAIVPAMTDFFAHLQAEQVTEIRLRGLRQSRLGLVEALTGASLMLRTPGMRPENQAILARSLTENGAAIVAELKRDDRLAVSAAAQSSLSSLAEPSKSQMRDFIAVLSSETCEGLCKLD